MDSKINMVETDQQLLPDDLVGEILSHLSAWNIAKFSIVSKSWNKMIKSPNFAQLHLKNYCNTPSSSSSTNNDDTCVFVRTFDYDTKILKVSMMLPGRPSREFSLDAEFGQECQSDDSIKLVGTVNGFICIYGGRSIERLALCNPYLGETETLPRPPTLCGYRIYNHAGLGFDPVRKEIKVVRLLCLLTTSSGRITLGMQAHIYSRNTRTWSRLECDLPSNTWAKEPISIIDNDGLFCHWVALRNENSGTKLVILSFDVVNEVFLITQLHPVISDSSTSRIKVFGRGNSLVLFSWYLHDPLYDEGSNYLDMWVLSGLGREGQWVTKAVIGPLVNISRPVCLWKRCGLILNDLTTRSFVIYDYNTREITISDMMGGEAYKPNVLEYKGSLVSLDT